jgi:hypothetical protein
MGRRERVSEIEDREDEDRSPMIMTQAQIDALRVFQVWTNGQPHRVIAHRFITGDGGIVLFVTMEGNAEYCRHTFKTWDRIEELESAASQHRVGSAKRH